MLNYLIKIYDLKEQYMKHTPKCALDDENFLCKLTPNDSISIPQEI